MSKEGWVTFTGATMYVAGRLGQVRSVAVDDALREENRRACQALEAAEAKVEQLKMRRIVVKVALLSFLLWIVWATGIRPVAVILSTIAGLHIITRRYR